MLLILKVVLTVTAMICAMLIGFVGILKLDISPNLTSFLTLVWTVFILYLPRIIFKEGDK